MQLSRRDNADIEIYIYIYILLARSPTVFLAGYASEYLGREMMKRGRGRPYEGSIAKATDDTSDPPTFPANAEDPLRSRSGHSSSLEPRPEWYNARIAAGEQNLNEDSESEGATGDVQSDAASDNVYSHVVK